MSKHRKKSANKRAIKASPARRKTNKPARPVVAASTAHRASDATSKQAGIIAMLHSPAGATIAAMMRSTGWQEHSVRGFLSGIVRKKLKLSLESKKIDGQRIYFVDGTAPSGAGAKSERHSA